jgi:protein ImuA
MPTHLLARSEDRPKPMLDLHPEIALQLARVHEACGPARHTFAMWVASRTSGVVLWISPSWGADRLNPDGMLGFVDPTRFLFVTPRRAGDLLWSCEESLRAGAVALVVADLPAAPALTPVRRMHLAAQTGAETGGHAPLGLLLTPGDGGAQGIETRWHMAPAHEGEARIWHLERRRARTRPPRSWRVTQTRALTRTQARLDLTPHQNQR